MAWHLTPSVDKQPYTNVDYLAMDRKPVKVAAVVFFVVALAHLSRLLFKFDLIIGTWAVPIWVNGIAVVVAFLLSAWLFKASRK